MIPGFRDTCVSAEIGVTCIVDCKDVAAACEAACSGNNDCIIGCNQELTSCLVSCPCMDDCPDGCNDCGHPLCSCQDPDSNPDYIACLEEMDIAFTNCVLACNHNQECYADCNRDYVDNVEKCPCNSNVKMDVHAKNTTAKDQIRNRGRRHPRQRQQQLQQQRCQLPTNQFLSCPRTNLRMCRSLFNPMGQYLMI